MRRVLALVPLLATAAAAYCPCFTRLSSANSYNCGVDAAPGTNPTVAQWKDIFSLVSKGPSAWGASGPSVGNIGQGCGKPMPSTSVPARFPCELLEAITYQESGWRQFCVPDQPADQVGGASRTIIAFDCGYGVGQVTSGMHNGEAPNFDRARVASDATYNLATGTQILAEKWRATNCVGDNQPSVIEHWYTATWAYNGLSSMNNPNNASFSTTRGVWRPSVGGSAPYQEKVFGWMEYPPSAAHWASLPFAYPKLSEVGAGTANSPPDLSEPSCASPTSCTSTRSTHVSACFASATDAGSGGGAGGGGGSATGGGGGGGTVADAGHPDAGQVDAGSTGGGGSEPRDAGQGGGAGVGAKSGCGCTSGDGFAALLALVALLRSRPGRSAGPRARRSSCDRR